jgi:hypothetical protein
MRPVALVYGALALLCAGVAVLFAVAGDLPVAVFLFGVLAACFAVLAVIAAR